MTTVVTIVKMENGKIPSVTNQVVESRLDAVLTMSRACDIFTKDIFTNPEPFDLESKMTEKTAQMSLKKNGNVIKSIYVAINEVNVCDNNESEYDDEYPYDCDEEAADDSEYGANDPSEFIDEDEYYKMCASEEKIETNTDEYKELENEFDEISSLDDIVRRFAVKNMQNLSQDATTALIEHISETNNVSPAEFLRKVYEYNRRNPNT